MFCSNCGKEIIQSDKYCSSCGSAISESSQIIASPKVEPQRKVESELKLKNGIIALGILAASILFVYGLVSGELSLFIGSLTGYSSSVTPKSLDLTMEEFNQIHDGMTIQEVNNIFHFEGVVISEIQGSKNYCWKHDVATIFVSFDPEGKSVGKSQIGLQN